MNNGHRWRLVFVEAPARKLHTLTAIYTVLWCASILVASVGPNTPWTGFLFCAALAAISWRATWLLDGTFITLKRVENTLPLARILKK